MSVVFLITCSKAGEHDPANIAVDTGGTDFRIDGRADYVGRGGLGQYSGRRDRPGSGCFLDTGRPGNPIGARRRDHGTNLQLQLQCQPDFKPALSPTTATRG